MEPRNSSTNPAQPATGSHENPLPGEISSEQKNLNESAHREADADMAGDAELTANDKNNELDEGELARLGDDDPGVL